MLLTQIGIGDRGGISYFRILVKQDDYEHAERSRLEYAGKIPAKNPTRSHKEVSKRISRTDPQAEFYKRKGKPGGMYYLAHQSVDAINGIIVHALQHQEM